MEAEARQHKEKDKWNWKKIGVKYDPLICINIRV